MVQVSAQSPEKLSGAHLCGHSVEVRPVRYPRGAGEPLISTHPCIKLCRLDNAPLRGIILRKPTQCGGCPEDGWTGPPTAARSAAQGARHELQPLDNRAGSEGRRKAPREMLAPSCFKARSDALWRNSAG